MKKLLSALICVAFTMSLFCFPVFAEESRTGTEIDQVFSEAVEKSEEKVEKNEDTGIKYGILQNENATVRYKFKLFPVDSSKSSFSSNDQISSQTYVFKLEEEYMEKEATNTLGENYGEQWAAQSGVKGYLTAYYNGVKNYGTLTQVIGGWDIHDGSMQVTNKHIIARTGNSRADFYPNGLYFNYSTGFTEVNASEVTSIADIVRGGDVWSCVFDV